MGFQEDPFGQQDLQYSASPNPGAFPKQNEGDYTEEELQKIHAAQQFEQDMKRNLYQKQLDEQKQKEERKRAAEQALANWR